MKYKYHPSVILTKRRSVECSKSTRACHTMADIWRGSSQPGLCDMLYCIWLRPAFGLAVKLFLGPLNHLKENSGHINNKK